MCVNFVFLIFLFLQKLMQPHHRASLFRQSNKKHKTVKKGGKVGKEEVPGKIDGNKARKSVKFTQ